MALQPEHRQEEWYQQMINAATGKYLPSITAQDVGKVLTVENDGSWGVDDVPTELPAVTDVDAGKVLAVDNSGVWGAQEQEFEFMALSDPSDPNAYYPQSGVSFTDVASAYMQNRKVYLIVPWQNGINLRVPLELVAESRYIDPETGAVTRTIAQMVFIFCDFGSTYITYYKLTWDYTSLYLAYSSAQVEHI